MDVKMKHNTILMRLYKINNRFLRKAIEHVILRRENGYAFSKTIRLLYSKFYGIEIGYGSYGGCFNHVNIPRPCDITFGNYCSIGSGLKIFRANHPSHNFTTHPFCIIRYFNMLKKIY